MEPDQAPSEDVEERPDLEVEAERKLREALARIDRVDDVQQRFLSEARRQVSELHVEAGRARAAALEKAGNVVADAEAEAASVLEAARRRLADAEAEAAAVLEAARQEAADLRMEWEQEVKAHAEVLLAVAHKERDELISAANAAAHKLRDEATSTAESLLNTAQAEAVRLVQEGKDQAGRLRGEQGGPRRHPAADRDRGRVGQPDSQGAVAAPDQAQQGGDLRRLEEDLRTLAETLGAVLERLSQQDSSGGPSPAGAPAVPAGARDPGAGGQEGSPAPAAASSPADPTVPLIGSRGNQAAPASSAESGGLEPPLRPLPPGGARPGEPRDHSPDWPRRRTRRGWRERGT